MVDDHISPDEIAEEKLINEEYKIWKKNSPFLYDLVVTHALDWPSLTVEWLPDIERHESKNITTRRMIMGTNTSNTEPNYLNIATVTLPSNTVLPDTRGSTYDDDRTGKHFINSVNIYYCKIYFIFAH